ncbi:MAG: MFS transporter [Endomicrobiaceae bacterium]|nr:MFS transporter [Endomicrobiaceae bacterium]
MRRKIISTAVVITYCISIIIPSGLKASDITDLFSCKKSLQSNLSCGRIFETNISHGEKPDIFFIHELHCNPEAQKNIFRIIDYIDAKFNVNAVFTEGAPAGEVNLSCLMEIYPKEVKTAVLNRMISEGVMSGSEYYCSIKNKQLYGIEDWDIYKQNINRFREIKKLNVKFLNAILVAKNDLEIQKLKVYNLKHYIYDSLYSHIIRKDIKYYEKIKELGVFCNINFDEYPQIKTISLILDCEQTVQSKKFQKDSSYFLKVLKQNIPFVEYKDVLDKNRSKNAETSVVFLYKKTKKFITAGELLKYNYIETLAVKCFFFENLNIKGFIAEEDRLKRELFVRLFKREKEKRISYLYLRLVMLEDYVKLSMTFEEWEEFKNNTAEFERILQTSGISNKNNISAILNNYLLSKYYHVNEYRNSVFCEKIKEKFVKGETYVLTAGGFHNDIVKFFKNTGLKYVVIIPDSSAGSREQYDRILLDTSAMKDALSDGILVSGISAYKQKKFIVAFIEELRKKGLNDDEIKNIIKNWQSEHKNFIVLKSMPEDLSDIVAVTNKSSVRGKFLKIRREIFEYLKNFKEPFVYKYNPENVQNQDFKIIKKMQSNIRFFPFIELMLGFNLYSSFSMLFMQSNGYSLGFISVIFSVLAPLSFVSSGLCGFIGDKISKRTLIIISLFLHTIGSILFIFSGLSPVILAVSQIIPVIAISGLGVSMSPFLMASLEKLNDKESFKKIYGSNMALFWIIMSVSSLLGGALLLIANQITVVSIAAIVDVACLTGAFIFTHKEKTVKEDKFVEANKKTGTVFKEKISGIFVPLSVLFSDKSTFSIVAVNIAVNNIFFVVLCFFLQPSLTESGLNAAFLAPVYFAANLLQSVGSNAGDKLKNIVIKHINRTVIFGIGFGLVTLFFITGSPLFLIGLYLLMNFWQALSSVTEVSAVYNIFGDNMRSKWLAFKAMVGTIVASITQLFITALLSAGVGGNILTAVATVVLTAVSFIVPVILYADKKNSVLKKYNIELSYIRLILASS